MLHQYVQVTTKHLHLDLVVDFEQKVVKPCLASHVVQNTLIKPNSPKYDPEYKGVKRQLQPDPRKEKPLRHLSIA